MNLIIYYGKYKNTIKLIFETPNILLEIITKVYFSTNILFTLTHIIVSLKINYACLYNIRTYSNHN